MMRRSSVVTLRISATVRATSGFRVIGAAALIVGLILALAAYLPDCACRLAPNSPRPGSPALPQDRCRVADRLRCIRRCVRCSDHGGYDVVAQFLVQLS